MKGCCSTILGRPNQGPWHPTAMPVAALSQRDPHLNKGPHCCSELQESVPDGYRTLTSFFQSSVRRPKVGPSVSRLATMPHTRVRYSPPADSLCVTLGRRIEGSPISSAHPPTSLLYLNFLLLGIFSSVAFLILDSFPDLFYFAIGSPDVVIYKGKNQQSESFPSFTQSAPSHCCLQNFVLPGGPASFSGETEDHS